MVLLRIIKINKYNYFDLIDNNGNNYSIQFEFHGLDIAVGDEIILHESLLDRKSPTFVQPYAFKVLNTSHKNIDNAELMAIQTKKGKFMLQRIYG